VAAGPDASPDRALFRDLPDVVRGILVIQRQRVYPLPGRRPHAG
jgi:hypothetical protein